jgi:hypothetical protein
VKEIGWWRLKKSLHVNYSDYQPLAVRTEGKKQVNIIENSVTWWHFFRLVGSNWKHEKGWLSTRMDTPCVLFSPISCEFTANSLVL